MTKQAQHTPGPWLDQGQETGCTNDNPLVRVGTKGGRYVALVRRQADARLIAAAPELLAALKMAVAAMRDADLDEAMAGEFEILTDAIAKATGEA